MMNSCSAVGLLAYLLSAVGLTILVVWPHAGPSAWIRDRVMRRALPKAVSEVFDCYICFGFWAGVLLSPVWWWFYREMWAWTGCLMTPALFWLILRPAGATDISEDKMP